MSATEAVGATRTTATAGPAVAGDARTVRAMAAVRIVFGLAWLIDALMKWSPSFTNGFIDYISGEKSGQPAVVKTWLGWWVDLMKGSPGTWAHLVAVSETLIAVGLIFGLCTRLVCVGGAVFSLLVWATAEGFGGPYNAGSTDVGTSIIYVVVFAAILATNAGGWFSLDRFLAGSRLERLGARPRPDIPPPARWAAPLAAIGVAGALAIGIIVAFVDSPAPPMQMNMSAPAVPAPAPGL